MAWQVRRQTLLSARFFFLIAGGLCWAQNASGPKPAFDVVSIKNSGTLVPGRIPHGICQLKGTRVMCDQELGVIIRIAYHVETWGYSAPQWVENEFYEVNAVVPEGTQEAAKDLMLQTMLERRLGLTYHREDRQLPIYALTVAKGGAKLAAPLTPKPGEADTQKMTIGALRVNSISLAELASGFLTHNMDRPVFDETGLVGKYRIDLDWSEELKNAGPVASPRGLDPSVIAVALKKVGLNLEPRRAPVKFLVVDHVNKEATPN